MWVAVGELLLKRHTNPLSQINKEIRLEAYTEQSESNPGRSLGIINKEGTAVWKTVPTNNQQPITNNRLPTIDAIRFVWKTIPSRARVTRDEVSGL